VVKFSLQNIKEQDIIITSKKLHEKMNASHAKREGGTSVNYTELFVFVAYFLFMLGIGLFFFMKSKNAGEKDYFLGGRNMGAWVSALSAGASDMSAWVLMGLPASIYAMGMGQTWIAIGLGIGYALSWNC
jgi:sodium/proline symporter